MKEEYYFKNWSFLTPPLFATFTNFFSFSAIISTNLSLKPFNENQNAVSLFYSLPVV